MQQKNRLDIIKARRIWYAFSGSLILIGVLSLVFLRLNVGVDFTGGRILQYRADRPVTTSEVERIINRFGIKHNPVQLLAGRRDIIVRTIDFADEKKAEALSKKIDQMRLELYLRLTKLNPNALEFSDLPSALSQKKLDDAAAEASLPAGSAEITGSEEQRGLKAGQMTLYTTRVRLKDVKDVTSTARVLYTKLGGNPQFIVEDKVNPLFGKEILKRALLAMGIAIAGILIYVTVRFEFWYAVAAIIALVHDVTITTGLYSLFRLNVDASFVAVVLTVFGYSINDTIVIFDRVRENLRKDKRAELGELINRSLWETMPRSINTIVTVELCILSIILFGGASVRDFTIGLFIGITFGGYSSIFVAAPLAYVFKTFERRTALASGKPGAPAAAPRRAPESEKKSAKSKERPAAAAVKNTPKDAAAATASSDAGDPAKPKQPSGGADAAKKKKKSRRR